MAEKKKSITNKTSDNKASSGRTAAGSKTSGKRNRKGGLGKGIGALFEFDPSLLEDQAKEERIQHLSIHDIVPMENQPRSIFDEESLAELADSIREHGVLQPIIVTKRDDKSYQIIAGERRWRASRMAELTEIPAIVREVEAIKALQQSIVENIQRENLNAMDEARAFERLIDEYSMTQEELATSLGRSRSAITNTLRLMQLPKEIQADVEAGLLSQGHARALLSLKDNSSQLLVAEIIIRDNLNVRQTETLVKAWNQPKKKKSRTEKHDAYALSIKHMETDLSKILGSKVKLKDNRGKGQIIIPYKSPEDLERLLDVLKG